MLRFSRFHKRDSIHKMAGKINKVGTSRPSTASRSGGRLRETTAEILHGDIVVP